MNVPICLNCLWTAIKQDSRWVFWGGDGKYLIGSFDGKEFKKESGPFTSKFGGNDYAAQSYSDIPANDGRRIQFSWMAGGNIPKCHSISNLLCQEI